MASLPRCAGAGAQPCLGQPLSLTCRLEALRLAHACLLDSAARGTTYLPSAALASAPSCTAFLFSFLAVVLALILAAAALDYFASQQAFALLQQDADLRMLQHCHSLQGHAFVLDRQLDAARAEGEEDALPLALSARQACMAYASSPSNAPTPHPQPAQRPGLAPFLASVAARAPPPHAAVLGSALVDAARLPALERRVLGAQQGACCARARALSGFLARLTLLRVYFSHALLAPFSVHSLREGRVSRLAAALAPLCLSFWAGAALYSFKSGGVAVDIPASGSLDEAASSLLLATLISMPAQQVASWLVGTALRHSDAAAFAHRYPYLAAEAARREAVDRRLCALSSAALAAEVAAARGKQGRFESGSLGESRRSLALQMPAGGEAEAGKAAAGAGAAAAGAAAAPSAPSAAALQCNTLLTLAPSDAVLIATAAAHLRPLAAAGVNSAGSSAIPGDGGFPGKAGEGAGTGSSERAERPQGASAPLRPGPVLCCAVGSRAGGAAVLPVTSEDDPGSSAALAAADRALESIASALTATVQREAARRWRRGKGGGCAAACDMYCPPASLLASAFLALLFGLFLWYSLLFGLVQGDARAAAYISNWVYSQAVSLLLLSPALKFLEAAAHYLVLPALPCAAGTQGSGARATASSALARDKEKMLVRAAGLASDLPPSLAFLAYGLSLLSSSATTVAVEQVADAVALTLKAEEELALEEAAARASPAGVLSEAQREALVVRRHVLEQVAVAVAQAVAQAQAASAAAAAAEPVAAAEAEAGRGSPGSGAASPLALPLMQALPHPWDDAFNPAEALRVLHEHSMQSRVPHYMLPTAASTAQGKGREEGEGHGRKR